MTRLRVSKKEFLNENIHYIFNSIIELIYQSQKFRESLKTRERTLASCQININNVKIYKKADEKSEVVFIIENANKEFHAMRRIKGLNDTEIFLYVSIEVDGIYKVGYVNEKNITMSN